MSLVVAIKAKEGAVLASDSRTGNPVGFYTDSTEKIFVLNRAMAIGCAGDAALNQEIAKELVDHAAKKKDNYIHSVASDITRLGQAVHSRLTKIVIEDTEKRTAFFLLIGYEDAAAKMPVILRFETPNSYALMSPIGQIGFATAGNDACAIRLLQNCANGELPLEQAKRLAVLCVVETAKSVNTVGGPVQLAVASGGEVKTADGTEIERLVAAVQRAHWDAILAD